MCIGVLTIYGTLTQNVGLSQVGARLGLILCFESLNFLMQWFRKEINVRIWNSNLKVDWVSRRGLPVLFVQNTSVLPCFATLNFMLSVGVL